MSRTELSSSRVGGIAVSYVEHGAGRPGLVLHGAGADHREVEACFEPIFGRVAGYRRIYPDLPRMGGTPAGGLSSAEGVLGTCSGSPSRSPARLRASSSGTRPGATTRRPWLRECRGR